MSDIILTPATLPENTSIPGSAQELVNLVSASLVVGGLEDLQGVVVSAVEPDPSDRDKLWVRKDLVSLRVIGLFTFNAGWKQVPIAVPNGEVEPVSPRKGELFFNTLVGSLKIYDGSQWTSNLSPQGNSSGRPTGVPTNFLYFDTEIQRLLRYTENGWTTADGFVGELRMQDSLSEDEVLLRNPGWEVYGGFAGKFPIGINDDITISQDGGIALVDAQVTVPWSAEGKAAHGLSREQPLISRITIGGTTAEGGPSTGSARNTSGNIDVTPPFKGVMFIKKVY